MKIVSKLTFGLATAAILFVGCGSDNNVAPKKQEVVKATISEDSLGLRKKSLYNENDTVAPRKTAYSTDYAGGSQKIKRAFQDAPPMIPHDTTGMLPIKINDNQCVGCHMPEVAKDVGATPIPSSHFTNFRPVSSYAIKGENTSSETQSHVSIKSTGGKLYGGRFNCSQCHAPQSNTPLAVENNFEAQYLDKDGASTSRWNGSRMLEGLDTTTSGK